MKTACRISIQSSGLIHDVKDTVSKAWEIANSERDSLKDFDLVVATFGKTVGIVVFKSVEYVLPPIMNSRKGCFKFGQIS